jgi:hypothetical protein
LEVKPYSTLRVAYGDSLKLEPTKGTPETVSLSSWNGISSDASLDDGAVDLPEVEAPDIVTCTWKKDGKELYKSRIVYVSRHYFELADLGDETDDFSDLSEERLWEARQSATETFELNAHRSFVRQLGETFKFCTGFVWLKHNDVQTILTDGWQLVSDCQAVGPVGYAKIRYVYGLDDVPARVSEAVRTLAEYYLRPQATPARATGEATDAGFIRYTLAGKDGATGLPEVDAAIEQFGRKGAIVL